MSARSIALVAALLAAGCASAPTRPDDDPVARALAGPVARSLVTAAPDAWAEVLREADRVRALSGAERAEGEVELALALEWGEAVAERAAAEASLAAASTRGAELTAERQRLDAEVTSLEESVRASVAAGAQAREAQAAARAPAVDPSRRAAVVEELDQQTELLLAASTLFGARPEAVAPLRARLAPARSEATDRLAAAAALYRDAEALLESTRASGAVVSTADVEALRLQSSLSQGEGVDAYRDARGVVAVVRGLFVGPRLAPTARSRVEMLARVIRSHGTLPVRLESFAGGAPAAAVALARSRATALRTALVAAGVPADRLEVAGFRRVPGGGRTDDRVEVVLLSPRAE